MNYLLLLCASKRSGPGFNLFLILGASVYPLFAYKNQQLQNWLFLLPAVHQLLVSAISRFCRAAEGGDRAGYHSLLGLPFREISLPENI